MIYRIHFNRETKNPAEAWVIQSDDGQILAPDVTVVGVCYFHPTDEHAVPMAWVEAHGETFRRSSSGSVVILNDPMLEKIGASE